MVLFVRYFSFITYKKQKKREIKSQYLTNNTILGKSRNE